MINCEAQTARSSDAVLLGAVTWNTGLKTISERSVAYAT